MGELFPTRCHLYIAAKNSWWNKWFNSEQRLRRTSLSYLFSPPSLYPLFPPPPLSLSLSLSLFLSLSLSLSIKRILSGHRFFSPCPMITLPHSSHYISSCLIMSHHVASCLTISHYVSSCLTMLHHVSPSLILSLALRFQTPFPNTM